jgi:hypothetical protein
MAQGPGSTRQNNGPFTVGGFYNFAPFTLTDGQACSLQFDVNGNLKVTSTGGGGGSNPAAGPTGAPVPADADYLGINIGGTLFGVTGFNLPDSIPIAVAIVNANGDQITSFGGGTQYVDGTAESIGAFTGTVAFGYNGTDVVGLRMDASDNLLVNLNTPIPAGTNLIGQIEVSDGTNVLFTNTHAGYVQFPSAQAVTLASTTITGNVSVTQAAASNPWIVAGGGTAGAPGTAVLTVQGIGSGTPIPVSGSVSVTFPVSPIVWIEGSTGVALDSAAGTPNAQAITIQGNASGVSVPVAGKLTHNNAAPAATQIGVLPGLANVVAPAYSEGDQVLLSTDLSGNLRISGNVTGSVSTGVVDESSFILGLTNETPVGGVFLGGSNVPTLAINQTGAAQLTADRKVVVFDPAMTILLDYVQTLILETRAMRSAIVYMITENQDVLTSDFDPNNQDFQPVN